MVCRSDQKQPGSAGNERILRSSVIRRKTENGRANHLPPLEPTTAENCPEGACYLLKISMQFPIIQIHTKCRRKGTMIWKVLLRIPFLKPSTKAFIQEAGQSRGVTFGDWLHGYIYARWPYLYIGVGTGEHPATRWVLPIWNLLAKGLRYRPRKTERDGRRAFADAYHGKVLTLEAARRLVTVERDIRLENLERIIPYRKARDLILKHPDHIAAMECPCRSSRVNPCKPLDVCLIIGEPFAGFVLEHHPHRARRITPQEAVAILTREHRRGHVHHAFFKDAMLGRFYAICNCCSCCCGAMQAMRHGTPMLAASGYLNHPDAGKCTACGACVRACPFEAIRLENGTVKVDPRRCMGCGVCVSRCKKGVHRLVRDARNGEPLEIQALMRQAMFHRMA